MHDSLAPLSGGIAMVNMLVSAIWGGIGCGLQQFIVYLLLGVFLAGVMTGRAPAGPAGAAAADHPAGVHRDHPGRARPGRHLLPRLPWHQPGLLRVRVGLCQQRFGLRRPG
ncbi:hypothetical protein G6F60_015223 [Rhizopus arrhizus]|nr:hypothetical protein G6F60_015223 [Rhizopus arrhizus]